ncbi:hypothetical protein [Gulosibacter bifidus]|uniref:Uncharacterized protein n=1 Tax=Gulosibacter bifidus TaxID=272239 RepID=A0ABW5RLK2_9MICO|nr:hypothetical protein [Gulosibacter bifidus]
MAGSIRRFDPPEPLFDSSETVATDAGDETAVEYAPCLRVGTGLLLGVATLTIGGLAVALAVASGVRVEPEAGERAPIASESMPGATDELFDVPNSTANPLTVKPGDTVPITVDATFTNGVTLVPPPVGDWKIHSNENRPEQFTASKHGLQIQVWQTDVFDSGQSDEAVTIAQLNRVVDECNGSAIGVSEPDKYVLTGKDGTKLEMLRVRVSDCSGRELWLLERVMPKTGTRFHIVVSASGTITDDSELVAKLREVTFTSP